MLPGVLAIAPAEVVRRNEESAALVNHRLCPFRRDAMRARANRKIFFQAARGICATDAADRRKKAMRCATAAAFKRMFAPPAADCSSENVTRSSANSRVFLFLKRKAARCASGENDATTFQILIAPENRREVSLSFRRTVR